MLEIINERSMLDYIVNIPWLLNPKIGLGLNGLITDWAFRGISGSGEEFLWREHHVQQPENAKPGDILWVLTDNKKHRCLFGKAIAEMRGQRVRFFWQSIAGTADEKGRAHGINLGLSPNQDAKRIVNVADQATVSSLESQLKNHALPIHKFDAGSPALQSSYVLYTSFPTDRLVQEGSSLASIQDIRGTLYFLTSRKGNFFIVGRADWDGTIFKWEELGSEDSHGEPSSKISKKLAKKFFPIRSSIKMPQRIGGGIVKSLDSALKRRDIKARSDGQTLRSIEQLAYSEPLIENKRIGGKPVKTLGKELITRLQEKPHFTLSPINASADMPQSRYVENRWVPKLLKDSNAYEQQTTDDIAAAKIMRETEAMAEDLDLLDSVGEENQRKLVSHLRRERSAGLRNKKIKAVTAEKHVLKCEVCDFNFEVAYGTLGKGFAEVHHIIPLSTLGETKTKLSDLAVLCSNCHRMIHRTNPIEDLETFRGRIQAIRAGGT